MEARLTIEGQLLGLSSSEFQKELDISQREFQKDILRRVHLLKIRDEFICNKVMQENDENTQKISDDIKLKIEEVKVERDQNTAIAMVNMQRAEKYSQLWYSKRAMGRCFQHLKDNWMAKKEAKTFIKTKVEKFEYNHVTIDQLKERVDLKIETELKQKTHRIKFLENLIRQLEDQYKIQLQRRALVKNVCDDGLKKGSMKMSSDALRMSMSTLKELESKFLKTYQAQVESQKKSTASKLERKIVFQPVTQ